MQQTQLQCSMNGAPLDTPCLLLTANFVQVSVMHWQQSLVTTSAYLACSSILRFERGYIGAVLNQVWHDLVGSVVIGPAKDHELLIVSTCQSDSLTGKDADCQQQ